MNKLDRSALGDALAERVLSLARANARLKALDHSDMSESHVVGKPDAELVLRSALLALCSESGYHAARRMLSGERLNAGDELAQAGLIVWDPGADSMRPTALLVELMRVFESAVDQVNHEP